MMNIATLLEMAGGTMADRVSVGPRVGGVTYEQLLDLARRAAAIFSEREIAHVGLIDVSSAAVPVAMFGAALSGRPFVPLNYRLADEALVAQLERIAPALVVVEPPVRGRLGPVAGIEMIDRPDFLARLDDATADSGAAAGEPDDVAVLLFTSGTTGDPKAAVLRHANLSSYVLSTVEFMGATDDEAALVSVPPYHIAGTSVVLSSTYAGRRIVYLDRFEPHEWVRIARDEAITHAMVVPTMLGRILDVVAADGEGLPTLAHLSYGGGRMPLPVIEQALELLPQVAFVNAYGLTETSSTIALLSPEDHRLALASDDPAVRARLGSVGRPLPSVELEIRDDDGTVLAPGEVGEIHVRGDQVSGEYVGRRAVSAEGWFPTNDAGHLDADGFLFVQGRLDDVIVRGAENISPGTVEDALCSHEAVADAAVVGIPDEEWGELVVAAVVLHHADGVGEAELQEWVRSRLRSSHTPARITEVGELPYNETGKLLRREVRRVLAAELAAG